MRYKLENGAPANLLGGFGSAIAYAGGDTFVALPDRGPNAIEFNDAIDNTASYISRFHTIQMHRTHNTSGSGLPFNLTPEPTNTTLLWIANDNDFSDMAADSNGNQIPNPNQFFVFSFTDADLGGSKLVPQEFREGLGFRR